MIIYLLVVFWLRIYGFTPDNEFMMVLCCYSIFETITETIIIIVFWGSIKKSIKNLFKN